MKERSGAAKWITKTATLLGVALCGFSCDQAPTLGQGGPQPSSARAPISSIQDGLLAPPVTSSLSATGASVAEANDADYLRVPNGRRLHKSCVHPIPGRGEVRANGDIALGGKVIEHVERCKYPAKVSNAKTNVVNAVDGSARVPGVHDFPAIVKGAAPSNPGGIDWINYAGWDFWVPPIPQVSQGNSIYLWPALLPADGSYVLQPVLSWGPLGEYGNDVTWEFSNWYCDVSNDCYHGPYVALNPGDDISASVQAAAVSTGVGQPPTGCNNQGTDCQWYMYFTINSDDSYIDNYWFTTNTVSQPPRQLSPATMEDYDFNYCNELPPIASVGFELDYFTMGDNSQWPWAGYWPQYHLSDLNNLAFSSTGVTPLCDITGGWGFNDFPNTYIAWNSGDSPQGM